MDVKVFLSQPYSRGEPSSLTGSHSQPSGQIKDEILLKDIFNADPISIGIPIGEVGLESNGFPILDNVLIDVNTSTKPCELRRSQEIIQQFHPSDDLKSNTHEKVSDIDEKCFRIREENYHVNQETGDNLLNRSTNHCNEEQQVVPTGANEVLKTPDNDWMDNYEDVFNNETLVYSSTQKVNPYSKVSRKTELRSANMNLLSSSSFLDNLIDEALEIYDNDHFGEKLIKDATEIKQLSNNMNDMVKHAETQTTVIQVSVGTQVNFYCDCILSRKRKFPSPEDELKNKEGNTFRPDQEVPNLTQEREETIPENYEKISTPKSTPRTRQVGLSRRSKRQK